MDTTTYDFVLWLRRLSSVWMTQKYFELYEIVGSDRFALDALLAMAED